jgi:oligoribonuclease NrnB/cAMP/cGMP phosphodiesterase (DHH superfamily)
MFSCGVDPFIICVYHNDVDGIVSKFNIGQNFNINQSIPADYNKAIIFDTNHYKSIIKTRPKIAFVVDFCLKEEEYDLLIESGFKIIVIDHHSDGRINVLKQNKYHDDINYLFSDQFSAAILTAYYGICYGLNYTHDEIGTHLDEVVRVTQMYSTKTGYQFLEYVDARDRGSNKFGDRPTYLHTYFKSFKFDENKIFEVYMNKVWVTDALTVGREIYMSEIEEIMTELRKMDWKVVTPTHINNNYVPKLLQFEPTNSCNATNVLKAVNMMQEAYKKYPVDGVIVQYHNERLSKVYNVPVYHVEIRMNDNNMKQKLKSL